VISVSLTVGVGLICALLSALGSDPLVIGVRLAAFVLILVGTALIPAPVRAGKALEQPAVTAAGATPAL